MLQGYICRFEVPGGKETRPLRYGSLSRSGGPARLGWHWKGWAGETGRPLYRLPDLVNRPEAPLLVVEGEKTADAASALFPEFVPVSPMNGAQSPHFTDWSVLAGRHVTIWPDADEPGMDFAQKVAKLARDAGAADVRIVVVPDGAPDGWDLADPLPDGWSVETIETALAEASPFDPDGEEQGTFRVQWRKSGKLLPGLHFRVPDKDSETGETVPGWHWFGSRLDVLGYTRDAENREWGRYLAVHDADGRIHHIAMPMAAMAGDGAEYRRELLRHGFVLAPGKVAREQLEIYLATWKVRRRVRCVDRIGWHGPRFVLPDVTYGPGGETVVLQTARPPKLSVAGDLNAWKRLVAAPAAGNSRLAFAISTSFAGPLTYLVGQESGGFHFLGGSSIGKTSILHAARSAWGCPLGSWRTTDNAVEATVAGACDTLLLLDEVSQADGRAVDAMAYMLGNGAGKSRATRSGGSRSIATWRILFLSTGEISLADKIAESGRQARAGQSVRVVDIPADAGKGLGIFDTLHDFRSGAELADQLRRAGEASSGHAARAFLRSIVDDPAATADALRECMTSWLSANLPARADGQVGRAAARFALVAAAGELVTALEIVPWSAGEASEAAARCFADWLAVRGGSGPEEITAGLRQVRAFLELHGTSRFEEAWPKDTRSESIVSPETELSLRRTINRAGFRRLESEGRGESWEYYVLPEAWRAEVCKGFDANALAKEMIARKWMTSGAGKHLTREIRVPGVGRTRLFCISSAFLSGSGE
ncbi:MAG: DUF927 domain-containing protein [Geminicoccaceae bacterium]